MHAEIPRWLLRPLVALAAFAAAGGVLRQARDDQRNVAALVASAAEVGVAGRQLAEIRQAVRREADPFERRLALARMLFPLSGQYRGPNVELRIARLELAEKLAAESLEGLPASWEAANLLGASRFESRKLRRDTRLFSAASEWELPLFAAVARSAGSPLVERFLAGAYLEVWPAMSESRRHQAAEILGRAFGDRRFYVIYFERWVQVAGSFERAAEMLPTDSQTARRLADLAVRGGKGEPAVRYHQLARERLLTELGTVVDQALGWDEPQPSRTLSEAIEDAPLGLDFAPILERSFAERLPYAAGLNLPQTAARWLLWSEPLCLVGSCPFSPRALEALLALAASEVGSPNVAFAALAAGKSAKAEQLARRANAQWSEDWADYELLAAKGELAAGQTAAARARLAKVHRRATRRPTFARLAREAAIAVPPGADPAIDPLAREEWRAADWRRDAQSCTMEIGAARDVSTVRIGLRGPPPHSFLLETELDGHFAGAVWVPSGTAEIAVPLEIARGTHVLRFRALGRVLPGFEAVRLD